MSAPQTKHTTINDMAAFIDDLLGRVISAPYHRGLEQYFILTDSDLAALRALHRYLQDFAVPYADDFHRVVVQKKRVMS